MQAVVIHEFGAPEVLGVEDRCDPDVPPGWVPVELRAAALNWHDCLVRRGVHRIPLPRILGADGAGVLRSSGERVMILPSIRWGDDERHPGPTWEILGDTTDGTYAELVAIPEENAVRLPRGWSFIDGAALALAGVTAYRALFTRGGLLSSETVLVLGAGGGVATMAISLARMAGARVLVTTSTDDKLRRARDLGAADGALYTDATWPQAIRDMCGGRGVDLAVDSAGAAWPEVLSAVAPGGRLVSLGATRSSAAQVDVRDFYFAQQSILGTTMGSRRDFEGLTRLIATSPSWRPVVDRSFPLSEAAAAHALMERHEHTGKLVLTTD